MKNIRKGLGKNLGMGYKNLAPMDSHIHSLSAKGCKTKNLYARKIVEQYKVYKFDELSKEVQEKVLEKHSNINVDYDWWDFVYEDYDEKLEKMGFISPDKSFSGFWSQGDGASFSAGVDVEKYLKSKKLGNKYKKVINAFNDGTFSTKIVTRGNYSHSGTMSDETYNTMDNEGLGYEVSEMILKDAKDMADKLYKDLEKEYDGLTSEESIKDTLEANEYEFKADGSMYSGAGQESLQNYSKSKDKTKQKTLNAKGDWDKIKGGTSPDMWGNEKKGGFIFVSKLQYPEGENKWRFGGANGRGYFKEKYTKTKPEAEKLAKEYMESH